MSRADDLRALLARVERPCRPSWTYRRAVLLPALITQEVENDR